MCRLIVTCITSVLAVVLCGCTTFHAPDIEVQSVTITETTADAMTIAFHMQLKNPNEEPIELLEFQYAMSVDGHSVYSGRRDAQATVPAGGTWSLTIPAVIPFSDVGWSADTYPDRVRYNVNGSLLYISPGALVDVLMDAGVYQPTTGFGATGALTLR